MDSATGGVSPAFRLTSTHIRVASRAWKTRLRGRSAPAFVALRGVEQDEVLRRVQTGTAPGDTWHSLDSARFFEELLADLAEAYYSHPLAQEEIGYVGMADAAGWARIRLDELEDREPLPLVAAR
jgi:hypothetical protein